MRRSDQLQRFLDASEASMCSARRHSDIRRVVEGVMAQTQEVVGEVSADDRANPPVIEFLQPAIAIGKRAGTDLVRVVDTFEKLQPNLVWRQRKTSGPGASDNFLGGHAYTMIVGPGGYEARDDVWIGASLLAPQVTYPDHDHPPEEAYLILSPGAFKQNDGDWQWRNADETFYNPPGILHGMRASAEPMLTLWFLKID